MLCYKANNIYDMVSNFLQLSILPWIEFSDRYEAYGDFNYTRPAKVALTDLVVRSDCFTVTFLKTHLMAGKKNFFILEMLL